MGADRVQAAVAVAVVADPDGDGVDVGLAAQDGDGVDLAAGDGGVAGVLAADLDPLPGRLRVLLAGLDALGVELHLQRGGLAGQLLVAQAGRGRGQDLVGAGGVGVGQAHGPRGDQVGAVPADRPGGHPGQRLGKAGGEGDVALEPDAGVVRGADELAREFVGRELARAAARPDPAGLRVLERGLPAAAELRDRHRLQVRRPGLQPPGRVQRAGQLVVGQGREIADGLLGEDGQHRAGAQRVGRPVLPEGGAEGLAAETVRAEHRRQQRRVQVAGVSEAERDGRPVELPLLRDPLPAGLDVRHPAGHLRVGVEVILGNADWEPAPAVVGARMGRASLGVGLIRVGRSACVVTVVHCGPPSGTRGLFLSHTNILSCHEDQLKHDT